jgi:hypothetical protein
MFRIQNSLNLDPDPDPDIFSESGSTHFLNPNPIRIQTNRFYISFVNQHRKVLIWTGVSLIFWTVRKKV